MLRRPMSPILIVKNQILRFLVDRVILWIELPPVRDIPSRKLSYEDAYGDWTIRSNSLEQKK